MAEKFPTPLGDMLLRIRISEIDGEYCIDSDDFAYALRRKPKLPDHDGLWWDKDNALWSVAIYDYEHAPAKCLYTTKDAADQLYGEYGEEIEVEG